MGFSHIKINIKTTFKTMTNTNPKTELNPFHSLKFRVSEYMASREFVAIDHEGNKSQPFKIKAGTMGEFFLSQSSAMKATASVNAHYGEETPMIYQLLQAVEGGNYWHYVEIL